MATRAIAWQKYVFEFTSIFVGVSLAFALENWNEDRRLAESETKTLYEIKNGLLEDKSDLGENFIGHQNALKACDYFTNLVLGKNVDAQLFPDKYKNLIRDYISIQNRSAYESLKSRGLELVKNDSLRLNIISLYDFYYEIVEKAEENYSEMQFHKNYFLPINTILSKHFHFSKDGNFEGINLPLKISKKEKNEILSYLWMIRKNRNFGSLYYKIILEKLDLLILQIDKELAK
jgi:hypothetical protein